jgi:hypothetical protein
VVLPTGSRTRGGVMRASSTSPTKGTRIQQLVVKTLSVLRGFVNML